MRHSFEPNWEARICLDSSKRTRKGALVATSARRKQRLSQVSQLNLSSNFETICLGYTVSNAY